jgi:hypothetical protein
MTLPEFLEHGRAVRAERERAAAAGEEPNFVPLVQSWGGVSLIYRKRLQDSPAYRLNHEEVQKALEEGINFIECMNPAEAVQAHLDLGARRSIGMHFGTFQLTPEGIDEPVRELGKALQQRGVPAEQFRPADVGESVRLSG